MVLDEFDGFLIDLDGVVWVGDALVPGADEALAALRQQEKRVLFLTNDPRSSGREFVARLARLGVEVDAEEVLTAGAATAELVARRHRDSGSGAFVIGSPALKGELEAAGIAVIEGEEGSNAGIVVVGGHNGFDYTELRIASMAVRRGAAFYATGRDASFPMPDGPWPATGAIVAAVETASGRPAHVVGKPEPDMFRVARDRLANADRVLVIGDRLDSDVAGGQRAGLATALVLTGSSTAQEAAAATPPPDFVATDLRALVLGA